MKTRDVPSTGVRQIGQMVPAAAGLWRRAAAQARHDTKWLHGWNTTSRGAARQMTHSVDAEADVFATTTAGDDGGG